MFENYEYKEMLEQALKMSNEDWEELDDRRRIWLQVDRQEDDNVCWEWIGCSDGHGYGAVNYKKKSRRAHKAIYIMTHGDINDNLVIRHTCDNKGCCNPKHLEIGTQLDNTLDRIHRQNNQRGENNYAAKLTAKDVAEIRKRVINGEKQKDLTIEYGLSTGSISQIITGWTWKDGFIGERKFHIPRTLTKEQVSAIKNEYDPAVTSQNKLAKKYGTSRSTIRRILMGDYAI